MRFACFLMASSFLVTSTAWSKTLTEEYKSETIRLLTELEARGVRQIACEASNSNCLYPDDLRRSITNEEIKWVELPNFEKSSGATRFSAFNSPANQTIYLNQSAHELHEVIGFVGLHEVIEVKGKEDRGFHISMAAVQLLSFAPSVDRLQNIGIYERLINLIRTETPSAYAFESPQDRQLQLAGGGIIVGGGGDTRALALRIQVHKALRKDVENHFGAAGSVFGLSVVLSNFYLYFKQLPIDVETRKDILISYEFEGWVLKRVAVSERALELNRQQVIDDIVRMYSSFGIGLYTFSLANFERMECLTSDKKKVFSVSRLDLSKIHPDVPSRLLKEARDEQELISKSVCRKVADPWKRD